MMTPSLSRRLLGVTAAVLSALSVPVLAQESGVEVDGTSFALNGDGVSYRFHVNEGTGDLVSDHFGGLATEMVELPAFNVQGWVNAVGRQRREFPDMERGDFRTPAIQIRQGEGTTVSALSYKSHDVIQGKPDLPGLPSTWGEPGDVTTLVVHLEDKLSGVAASLSYSIFPKYDAVARSVNITNNGDGDITIEKIASLSVDLPYEDLDMIDLRGDWARETQRTRRHVEYGTQGFGSSTGYSSHLHNPFFAVVAADTTETQGEAWGFSFIYTGSFSAEVEKGSQGLTRAMMGLNPYQLSWKLGAGETFTSPECVAVYSDSGVGGMSRKIHRLFNNHLIRSSWAMKPRPVLLNSWEGLYFDYNQSRIERLAGEAADLGVSLFVLDDGWFGDKYPRVSDDAGLGDWVPNPDRFPNGLTPAVDHITSLDVANHTDKKLQFGLWFEPEMVNPNSTLYHTHPDWALHAGDYARTLTRNELVLNLGLPEVQDYVIASVSNILKSSDISYVKWDNNRGMHQAPTPSAYHAYMLGLYNVLSNLTTQYPDVLWEGCASGGGRFDPGILRYFPQTWTSDNTDALDRIFIQFGTSVAYPAGAMAAHISAVPNGNTGRNIPMQFRGHVALMGGSFGVELDPEELKDEEKAELPGLIALSEKLQGIIRGGDMYRLRLPEDTNWPAMQFLETSDVPDDGPAAVLFAFQVRTIVNHSGLPSFRFQGLSPTTRYKLQVHGGKEFGQGEKKKTYSGATLMNVGLTFGFDGDYDSRIVILEKA